MTNPTRKNQVRDSSSPPIVGIGASAGGLEALEAFFFHVPLESGLGFVVIQHQDPTYKGMLPELLQRSTSMKVVPASNRVKVKPDCIYVIPPNKDLSILHGSLYLLDPVDPRGLRLPIDFFLRSLAEDQRERAVGVILSGMGSDGTFGLRAIKENAGLVLVQEPSTAKFDGMPRSAINAGLADIIAPAQDLPQRLTAYFKHSPRGLQQEPEPIIELKSQSALEQIIILLREHTGNDFLLYKKNTIYRRIERRMGLHQIHTIAGYVRFLRENPQELDLLFKELLIGVTSFFRDPQVWEQLKNEAIPALLDAYPKGKELRAWVPACSTGEEAYSLAIVFKEALKEAKPQAEFSLQIFATDLDEDAIEKARQAFYPGNISADVSPARLDRYFTVEDNGYRINKEIREKVIFAPQNIIMDPPFTKLDILSCRNLLIYLGPDLQKKLIPLFHYTLNEKGVLMLGNAETIGGFTQLFKPVENNSRLYWRIDNHLKMLQVDFPIKFFPVAALARDEPTNNRLMTNHPLFNLQALADQLILQNFAPAAVMINAEGDILYINGRTGLYLEPAAGKANWNIHAMAREEIRYDLAVALKKAMQQVEPVLVSNLTLTTNGSPHTINLIVQAIQKPEALRTMFIVVFQAVPSTVASKQKVKSSSAMQKMLQEELQQVRDELQVTREEMQTSQEDLKSANEELQSSNEELQSTNEELTTSKEEMQSLNEELQTCNIELQSKVDDLTWVNNDMKNLLDSMEIATVFLDNFLNIRRYTTHATHLFKLIPGDVGRPLSDIVTELDYPQLLTDAREVLRTLVYSDKQIVTHDGRWYKVRIMPYRTQDYVIDGVVITLIDICETKGLEAKFLAANP
ncbi:MAG: chemotaxis protein CheB [Methylicorpusculum sp.]|uniref:chemotaxis protein CheB n=1 Tax=Methylicorpusculum sp. TaxID=2713644 RepID=UPI00272476F3|nr:chemotaxis protein CheB [Methylicorpusculum sp.]MDO8939734.1 chemotaxis protein CheB [Methylicorpusculum sp.]MDP2201912.1 chemotaxis protein CheB [Methylicorpusculum sp.]